MPVEAPDVDAAVDVTGGTAAAAVCTVAGSVVEVDVTPPPPEVPLPVPMRFGSSVES